MNSELGARIEVVFAEMNLARYVRSDLFPIIVREYVNLRFLQARRDA